MPVRRPSFRQPLPPPRLAGPDGRLRPQKTVIFYRGPSVIDGAAILGIAAGFEAYLNPKVGPMISTYIVRDDQHPVVAQRNGDARSVCGSCPLMNRGCYVAVGQAPANLWRAAVERQAYPTVAVVDVPALFAGRRVRLGTYGDPAAIPESVWSAVLAQVAGFTGYTHQWRAPRFAGLSRWCMASVESADDARLAHARGWSTFRIVPATDTPLLPDERFCPATAEGGHQGTCATCLRCGGQTAAAAQGRPEHVVTLVHGARARLAREVLADVAGRSRQRRVTARDGRRGMPAGARTRPPSAGPRP